MINRCKTANQCYMMGVMYCSFHNDAIDIRILNKWRYFFCISFIEDIYLSIYLCPNGKQINDVMSDKISLIFFAFVILPVCSIRQSIVALLSPFHSSWLQMHGFYFSGFWEAIPQRVCHCVMSNPGIQWLIDLFQCCNKVERNCYPVVKSRKAETSQGKAKGCTNTMHYELSLLAV